MAPELAEKLMEWERRRDAGDTPTPEELCADSPQLVEEVRRRIGRLEACDQVLSLTETATAPHGPEEEIPGRIAGFEIRGRLGRGGMGDVYDGWDPALEREVAIKVVRMPADYWPFARTRELAGRFGREGAALARLEHPHIVPVYQAGVWEDRPYIVMGRVAGGSLANHLHRLSGQGPRSIAEFMEKVARAVHAAHEQGVLHRDLKPANILVDGNGNPRVADFGLAKFWSPTESPDGVKSPEGRLADLTGGGRTPGTPAYMAPEQFDPKLGKVGPATDVWALGIILYELLTGGRPFAGETQHDLAEQVCSAAPVSCRVRRRDVPRWLDAVVTRCLAKAPGDRYRSAAELAAALRVGLPRRRRWVWVASSAAILMLAAGIVVHQATLTTPDRGSHVAPRFEELPEVVDAMGRLANGEEVVLVDGSRHGPFHRVFGTETVRVVESDPARLTLYSRWTGPGTAEFLPALPAGRYRVHAVVRHDTGDNFTQVSLYVGGRHWQSARGEHLGCIALAFADAGPEAADPPKSPLGADRLVALQSLLTGHVQNRRSADQIAEFGKLAYPVPAAGRDRPFRTIELDISDDAVEARWDGRRVGRVALEAAAQRRAKYLASYPELEPAAVDPHPFRGGIGLIVYNGTVSVTDFRVTPLK